MTVPPPLSDDGGACRHLKDDKTCGVYFFRPKECRVDVLHQEKFSYMTQAAYYKATNQVCNQLIQNAGLPDSYLIQIGES